MVVGRQGARDKEGGDLDDLLDGTENVASYSPERAHGDDGERGGDGEADRGQRADPPADGQRADPSGNRDGQPRSRP